MRIGSLFSGIGGLELGLEWAGVGHTVWQVEQSAWCRGILAQHWLGAQRFDDVRTVGAHNLSPVDVICGGFPCQDISYAGRGAGLAGERSGLWHEFARIVGELGPRYVVVENVRALATRGLDAVLGTLADLGYDAEWSNVSARSVGAPHLRNRIFIVAYSRSHGRETDAPTERSAATCTGQPDSGVREKREPATRGADVAHPNGEGPQGEVGGRTAGAQGASARHLAERGGSERGRWHWDTEPNVGRVAHGVPDRVDRITSLGNAVVPQVAAIVGRRLMQIAATLDKRGSP